MIKREAGTMGYDNLCSFPTRQLLQHSHIVFPLSFLSRSLFFNTLQKEAGERKAVYFITLFPHRFHFLQCFCSLCYEPFASSPNLNSQKLKVTLLRQQCFNGKTVITVQKNSHPLTQTLVLKDHRNEK